MSNTLTTVNLPLVISDTSSVLERLTTALRVPREVLASDDEIAHAWQELPRLLEKIPPQITGAIQFLVTWLVIRSEQSKLTAQLHADQQRIVDQLRAESRFRRWESKYTRLVDILGRFIAATDPDIKPDVSVWLPLLHQMQFLLRYDNGPEQKLNGSINDLGFCLQGIRGSRDRAIVLQLQSRVVEDAKALFASFHHGHD